jgi:hypothetical protein
MHTMKESPERGREAPMVINPLRLARQLVGIARSVRAGRRKKSPR